MSAFQSARAQGRREGAAVAFGLMGMAEAIRARDLDAPHVGYGLPGCTCPTLCPSWSEACAFCKGYPKRCKHGVEEIPFVAFCGTCARGG